MPNRYRKDPFWARKKLTPGQLQVCDIGLKQQPRSNEAGLEIDEVLSSSLIPEEGFGESVKLQNKWLKTRDNITSLDFTSRAEEQHVINLQDEYGWMSELRLKDNNVDNISCRWIHIPNKFRKNLSGVLIGMSDWSKHGAESLEALRLLERVTQDQERFSKHGKMFAPFFETLSDLDGQPSLRQFLVCAPFLDWAVHPDKETPPLRFQIDDTDTYYSTRSSAHPLRSLLQHYYRLEDTSKREADQVFAKHRPWYTDRDMDLRVRRWYGHYPAGMVVDEIWILVVDERHIVTFSSNQSWKSRWPPMQVQSRIFELSFRDMSERFKTQNSNPCYSSTFHAIASIHGAIGLMHRSFWTDMPLPCTERYGGYLSHLQYRIYRSPSTRLVMDLLQAQDELNIIQDITQQQLDVLSELRSYLHDLGSCRNPEEEMKSPSRSSTFALSPVPTLALNDPQPRPGRSRSPAPLVTSSTAIALDAVNSIVSKLTREQGDITSLKTSSNDLLTRTIQLVNIRTESHNQAILVFTVITVIFLPLSFMASFFGMNTTDIRNLQSGQWLFWASSLSLTAGVVILSIMIAFYGPRIGQAFSDLKAGYIPHQNEWIVKLPFVGSSAEAKRENRLRETMNVTGRQIVVLDSEKHEGYYPTPS